MRIIASWLTLMATKLQDAVSEHLSTWERNEHCTMQGYFISSKSTTTYQKSVTHAVNSFTPGDISSSH